MLLENRKILGLLEDVEMTGIIKEDKAICGVDEICKCIALKIQRCNPNLIFIGNGGSAAIATHMTADFMKNGGIKTISMYDVPTITCLANDFGYEYVFSKQIEKINEEKNLLVAISSSGKSQNIINAIKAAREKKADVYTFTGFDEDNPIRKLGDINVYVPCHKYGIVESIHNLILQEIVDIIMERDGVRL